MTRLLVAIDSMMGGGAERVTASLASALAMEIVLVQTLRDTCDFALPGHVQRIDLPSLRVLPGLERMVGIAGARAHGALRGHARPQPELQVFLASRLHALLAFDRVVRAQRPDVILSTLLATNLVVLAWHALTRSRIPVVIADHTLLSGELDGQPFLTPVLKRLVRLLYPRADAYVGVSRGVALDAQRAAGLDAARVHTIPNGIDVEAIRALAGEPLPAAHPMARDVDGARILALGRLAPEKGFDVLLEAFARFRATRPGTLFIGGQGEDATTLRLRAEALGISGHVKFLGFERQPFACMARAHVLVMPSRREACPMVLLEGLAVGVPIVAADCPGGTAELLGNGEFGVLTPVGDAGAMADVLTRILDDDAMRADYGRRGPEGARRFAMQRMVDGYKALITELAAQRR